MIEECHIKFLTVSGPQPMLHKFQLLLMSLSFLSDSKDCVLSSVPKPTPGLQEGLNAGLLNERWRIAHALDSCVSIQLSRCPLGPAGSPFVLRNGSCSFCFPRSPSAPFSVRDSRFLPSFWFGSLTHSLPDPPSAQPRFRPGL